MLTPEQKKLRQHGIGSSEIAAVCGMNPFSAPMDVWMVKTGRKPDFEGNEATEIGEQIEDWIANRYLEKHEDTWFYRKSQTYNYSMFHEEINLTWPIATPDRLFSTSRTEIIRHILEIKNVGPNACRYWDDNTADGIPLYVWAQVQWQMFVTGIKKAVVCAFLGGARIRWWEFDYDQDKAEKMFAIASKFWHENVLADKAPDETDPEYVKLLHPKDNGKMLDATDTIVGLAQDRIIADTNWKAAKEARDKIDNQLKAIIGPASGIEGVCTYRADKNGRRNIKFNYGGE